MAAVAQQERDMISVRTKDALREAKARGTKLGNPRPERSLEQGRETVARHRAAHHVLVKDTIAALRAQRMTLRAIADELNARGIPTVTGRHWEAQQVRNVLSQARETALVSTDSSPMIREDYRDILSH